jgi:hypothetical protein
MNYRDIFSKVSKLYRKRSKINGLTLTETAKFQNGILVDLVLHKRNGVLR